jgi:hypothetical protein
MKWLMILLLCGCTSAYDYRPALKTPPKDLAKYEADVAACRERAIAPLPVSQSLAIGAFGVFGAAAVAAENPDGFKRPTTLIDECLQQQGYSL